MKSVVVEASTVAKAIELAWRKAENPEEFFIRVLQEHQTGFLGFGAQKAKIVLFFKNIQKSDSLFPAVLQQKEYESLFDNKNLQIPAELNVIDAHSNKNINIGHQKNKHIKPQHKNQQHNQNNQKKTVSVQQKPESQAVAPAHHHAKKPSVQHHHVVKPQQEQIQHGSKKHHAQDHQGKQQQQAGAVHKDAVKIGQSYQDRPIQQPAVAESIEKKHDVVQDVARVLKKVQSQKILAPVSPRPVQEKVVHDTVKKNEGSFKQALVENTNTKTPPTFKRRPLNIENSEPSGIVKKQDNKF